MNSISTSQYKTATDDISAQNILTPQCSCAKCDSFGCFAIRSNPPSGKCKCYLCSNSKTCLYYCSHTPNFRQNKSSSAHLIQRKSKEKFLGDQESYFKEHITEETIYSIDTKTNKARIVSQKQSKYSQSSNSKMFNEAAMDKDSLRPQVRSIAVTYPRKDINSSTAKLSAQVMNVPYNQFNESFDRSDNSSYKALKLSTYDIFKRIKEAYKACSCKVCECVTSRFSRKDSCKCKPCDCDDCKGFGKLNKGESSTQLSNIFCPCVRCDRRDCKAITKKRPFACDCSPCDCMQCVDEFTKPCKCKPCQCIECKSISVRNRTVVVAPVGEEHQRNLCQCSPCDCIECGNPSLMHNMSTGIDRHQNCRCESCLNDSCVPDGIDSCNCVRRNQVMRKPVERDTRDYDIHRASIANKNSLNKDNSKHDTIAMFATLTKDYPSFTAKNITNGCEICRKVKSNLKDSTTSRKTGIPKTEIPQSNRDLNLHTIYETSKKLKLGNSDKNICKCSPCECQICHQGTLKSRKDLDAEKKQTKSCKCDVCACWYCDALSNSGANDEITFRKCKCNPCECVECQNKMTKCNDIVCHCSNCKCESCIEHNNFVRKAVNYNRDEKPFSFKTDISDPRFLINFDSTNHSLANPNGSVSENRDKKSPKELSVYHMSSLENIESSGEEYSNNFTNIENTLKRNIQYKSGTKRHNQNKPNSCSIASKETSFLSDSRTFGHIYFGAQSKTSYFKESESTSQSSEKKKPPHLACKQPSWGSYNSSAFESPNKFPRTTVEKCLNDVLKLNLDKSINLDKFIVSSPSKVNSMVTRNDQTKTLSPNLWMCHSELSRRSNVIDDIDTHGAITPSENNQFNLKIKKYDLRERDYENSYDRLIRATVGDSEFQKKEIETQTLTEETFYDRHNIDYVKAHHTLQEAKAFSLELLKILHKYEKANREFKSMSQTVKLAENRILSKHNVTINNMQVQNCEEKNNFKPEKELQKKGQMEKEEDKINNLNNKTRTNKFSSFLLRDHQNVIFIQNYLENFINSIIDNKHEKTSNCALEATINKYNNIICNKESLNVSAVKKYNKLIRKAAILAKENRVKKGNTAALDEVINKTEQNNTEINVKQETEPSHYNKEQIKEKVSHHIKEMNKILFDAIEKITEPNVLNINKPKCAEYEDNVVVEDKKTCFESRPAFGKKNLDTKLNTDNEIHVNKKHYENRTLVEALGEVKNLLNMPQLQCCGSTYQSSSGYKTNLELQLRDSSSQTRSMFPYNINRGAHSMFTTKYQNDPFKIPTLSDLKKLYWKSNLEESNEVTETYLPKINSSVSSCDALKVCMLCVRRVSDHTVMVKWETPRNVENVQGYELLVDGRAVQKIFSPSRRMAVITCLPHCEKVLLTVRTIVTSDTLCEHHPTATIVYRPREK